MRERRYWTYSRWVVESKPALRRMDWRLFANRAIHIRTKRPRARAGTLTGENFKAHRSARRRAAAITAINVRRGQTSWSEWKGCSPPARGLPGPAGMGSRARRAGRNTAPAQETCHDESVGSWRVPELSTAQRAGGPPLLATVMERMLSPARMPPRSSTTGSFQL